MLSLIKKVFLFIILACSNPGCRKYLEQKSDQSLVVINTVQDLQSLMDRFININFHDPCSGEISADDNYLPDKSWSKINSYDQAVYIWQKDHLFAPGSNNDWSRPYNNIYIANLVLSKVDDVPRTDGNQAEWNNVKGQALFLRGKSFLQIAWIWAMAYDEKTADVDLGIPLRLDPDFNTLSQRASVRKTYNQVIDDLKSALDLLPVTPAHVMRPSKAAACGWLARAYLSMQEYDSAGSYANQCLNYNSTLIDYNSLDTTASTPFPDFNAETIFFSILSEPAALESDFMLVDSNLYASYDGNDLRKSVYYYTTGMNQYRFKGSYAGLEYFDEPFNGIATDEMYLMRAECYARAGNIPASLADLNTLLATRWRTGTFIPYAAASTSDAITMIKAERRKELHNRGLRWMDIKRYNKEGDHITLTRMVNGQSYILQANDPRYGLAIPEDVIEQSGMTQNPR